MTSDVINDGASFDLLGMDRRISQRLLLRRLAKLGAFGGLVVVGVTRGGILGWLGSGVGLWGLASEVGHWLDERPHWQRLVTPGHLPGARLLRTSRVNSVDQASSASFPASDAPTPHQS